MRMMGGAPPVIFTRAVSDAANASVAIRAVEIELGLAFDDNGEQRVVLPDDAPDPATHTLTGVTAYRDVPSGTWAVVFMFAPPE